MSSETGFWLHAGTNSLCKVRQITSFLMASDLPCLMWEVWTSSVSEHLWLHFRIPTTYIRKTVSFSYLLGRINWTLALCTKSGKGENPVATQMDTKEIKYKLMHAHRLRYSDTQRYSCGRMGTDAHTFRRKTLMVKQMLRKYLDPQIYIHSHRHTLGQKHICVCTHTLPLKTGFLIPQFLQVSYDLIYFRTHTVIYCYKFSQNHAAQKKTHIYVVSWFNKGATAMQQIKDDFFLLMLLDQLHIHMEKKMKLDPYFLHT